MPVRPHALLLCGVGAMGAMLLAGCYVYRPGSDVVPAVGTRVAAQLTGTASDTLTRVVGPGIATVRGDVVAASDSAVILAVTSVIDRSGRDQSWQHEHLRLGRATVLMYQQRRLSVSRSVLLGLALAGGAALSLEAFQGGTRGGGILPGGGNGAPK